MKTAFDWKMSEQEYSGACDERPKPAKGRLATFTAA
jgi:hypothetical protein